MIWEIFETLDTFTQKGKVYENLGLSNKIYTHAL